MTLQSQKKGILEYEPCGFYFQQTLKGRKSFDSWASVIKRSASWKWCLCLALFSLDLVRKTRETFWTKTRSKLDGERLQLQCLYSWKAPPHWYEVKTCYTYSRQNFLLRTGFCFGLRFFWLLLFVYFHILRVFYLKVRVHLLKEVFLILLTKGIKPVFRHKIPTQLPASTGQK